VSIFHVDLHLQEAEMHGRRSITNTLIDILFSWRIIPV